MDNKIIATGLIASALTFGATTLITEDGKFDEKGQDVKIQVLVKEANYQDAVYYTPTEWETKTEQEINAEKAKRYDDWKKLVEEESKKDTPVIETIDEIIP